MWGVNQFSMQSDKLKGKKTSHSREKGNFFMIQFVWVEPCLKRLSSKYIATHKHTWLKINIFDEENFIYLYWLIILNINVYFIAHTHTNTHSVEKKSIKNLLLLFIIFSSMEVDRKCIWLWCCVCVFVCSDDEKKCFVCVCMWNNNKNNNNRRRKNPIQ